MPQKSTTAAEDRARLTFSKKEYSQHVKRLVRHFNVLWKARGGKLSRGYQAALAPGVTIDSKDLKVLKDDFIRELKETRKSFNYGARKMVKAANGAEVPAPTRGSKASLRRLTQEGAAVATQLLQAQGLSVGEFITSQGVTTRDNFNKIFYSWGRTHKGSQQVPAFNKQTGQPVMNKPKNGRPAEQKQMTRTLYDLRSVPLLAERASALGYNAATVPMFNIATVLKDFFMASTPASAAQLQQYAPQVRQEYAYLKQQADVHAAQKKVQNAAAAKAKREAEKMRR